MTSPGQMEEGLHYEQSLLARCMDPGTASTAVRRMMHSQGPVLRCFEDTVLSPRKQNRIHGWWKDLQSLLHVRIRIQISRTKS